MMDDDTYETDDGESEAGTTCAVGEKGSDFWF